ncbi:MAG: UDP-2,4-diacetamido-2,4,6-trideoxy-beta-L-altropyranose hydrolase, partial [Gemmobacter sp.]
MKVAFRADASLQIGTGHVMRCLTLADALAARGADCQFICGAHEGNLIEFIRGKGYVAHALPIAHEASPGLTAPGPTASTPDLAHAHWLGTTQAQDAEACAPILAAQRPDWLI